MSIKLTISDKVGFKVRGVINDAAGLPLPFDFGLVCQRLDADQIQRRLVAGDENLVEFLADVTESWSGVRDAEDKLLPYSPETLRQLCKISGVAGLMLRTYLAEVGAKEKN